MESIICFIPVGSHGKRILDDDSMNYIFNGFKGWCKYSEIAHAVSDKPNDPYKYVSTVLKSDGDPGRWDRFTMHNPQIRKFGNYYYLYYISNSFDSSSQFKDESIKRFVQRSLSNVYKLMLLQCWIQN